MARLNRLGFLAVAVLFHLIYMYSIFDIYFTSPIVHGMREYRVERPDRTPAPAKRLVLIVGDGLRADKAFQSFPDPSPSNSSDPDSFVPRPLAPFLRSRVLDHGTFGVSHTRVPTESRPGHVALIAGLYEDVSAVMTGWKLNPVNFDSVFNRSRHTWSWGSPDILPMFKEGAVPGRVDADVYSEEAEDYTQDATHLDIWVFDRVKAFFDSAATNSTLDALLHKDKLVFFLHLLGLDTTGHAYRPYSKEYLHNIKVVDRGIQEITELIERFYGDGQTAFVFTADHGMSDWGSHGDGHPDNTRTPLIAWGSGVAKPVLSSPDEIALGHEDGFSADWGLDSVQRNDVSQADIAALMAYLAGLDFPVNSVGEMPLAYLAGSQQEKAEAMLVNAREILEMYRMKEAQKRSTKLNFKPYPLLSREDNTVQNRVAEIRRLIDGDQPEEAIARCKDLIQICLDGLRYLQTYDWLFLRAIVTTGYLGWIAFALTTVIDLHVLQGKTETSRTTSSIIIFSSVLVALYSLLWVQQSPWTYYAYTLFPVVFWEEVIARRNALIGSKSILFGHVNDFKSYFRFVLQAVLFIGVIEGLVQGYFHREVFSACFVVAAFWPAMYGVEFIRQNQLLLATWVATCFIMSSFTLLPVVKVESVDLIIIGGLLMFAVGVYYLMEEENILGKSESAKRALGSGSSYGIARTIIGLQIGLIALALLVTKSSVASLQAKKGLPLGTQVVGWLVLGSSLGLPFLHNLEPNSHYLHRLLVIFLTFSPTFIILTISYEGLFYVAFCATLLTWVRVEHKVYEFHKADPTTGGSTEQPRLTAPSYDQFANPPTGSHSNSTGRSQYRPLTTSDARIALFFLVLLQSAFFSTGNIASISSFSLDSVYRLIPVFNPFSQGALLIFKILIPFAIISANLGILNRRLGVAPSALFMLVMAITDIMTLNFFFMVKDEGSWLDIGTTISHFCIASGLCVFVAALEAVSEVFVSGVDFEDRPVLERAELVEANGRDRVVGVNGGTK